MLNVVIAPMTSEVVPEAARLHREAFAGYMSSRLGYAYIEAFMHWFRRAERTIALVATDDHGQVLGYVVGAPQETTRSINRDLFWVAAGGVIMHPWLLGDPQFRRTLVDRARIMLGHASTREPRADLPAPIMSLVGIGVLPSARGKQVGLRLVRAFEARAREEQMRSLRLSVYPDNTPARRLYERCGWQPVIGEVAAPGDAMKYSRILNPDRV